MTGCTRVTARCDQCYAATLAGRRLRHIYLEQEPVVDSAVNRIDPFAVRVWPERLEQPRRWSEPRMIFVNSMSDLFHQDVPEDFLIRIFEVMLASDRHVYQVLTKRPARAAQFWRKHSAPLDAGLFPSTSGSEPQSKASMFSTGSVICEVFRRSFGSCPASLCWAHWMGRSGTSTRE